jgi:acyl-CoA reductase-like NAD-dependent aldehyde dehydrogenase
MQEVLPQGVLEVVVGDAEAGAALAASPDVDLVAHVGSTRAGRAIAAAAARSGAKVLLENGGNDPLLVDGDVDPAWAAEEAALGAFANAGQICTSVERIYVVESVADRFLDALVDRARSLATRPGTDPSTRLGPLVDRRMRDEVHGHVVEAVDEGAEALVGGAVPDGPGSFYPATVLQGCTPPSSSRWTSTVVGGVAPVQVAGRGPCLASTPPPPHRARPEAKVSGPRPAPVPPATRRAA